MADVCHARRRTYVDQAARRVAAGCTASQVSAGVARRRHARTALAVAVGMNAAAACARGVRRQHAVATSSAVAASLASVEGARAVRGRYAEPGDLCAARRCLASMDSA